MENLFFLVKADLLLHENTFEKLRNFVENIDVSTLSSQQFYTIDYSVEKDDVDYYNTDISLYPNIKNFLTAFYSSGYMFMDFATLKKYLNI